MKRAEFLTAGAAVALAPALKWVPSASARPTGAATLARAVRGREAEFPLLAHALRHSESAHAFKVEWNVAGETWENYTQIVRHCWRFTDTALATFCQGSVGAGFPAREKAKQLTRHLASIEQVLWHGVPTYTAGGKAPRHTCGGVLHFLGRNPRRGDVVALRPLKTRDLKLMEWEPGEGGADEYRADWLSEFSLMVIPRERIAA